MQQSRFDDLVREALAAGFSGWDFSWARGRWFEPEPSWDYEQMAADRIDSASSLLDMGTGGGEFLASLGTLPPVTYATESYPPNISVARARLEPLGVTVLAFEDDRALPLPDESVDLVINRHDSYWPLEVHRILESGGVFLTQQVGPANCIRLNEFLQAPADPQVEQWTLASEVESVERAGFEILRAEEEFPDSIFYDVGAVVFYLKIISWQIPDFEVATYRERLRALHALIDEQGRFNAKAHRYLIEARKR